MSELVIRVGLDSGGSDGRRAGREMIPRVRDV
jgi:hypothetical protein